MKQLLEGDYESGMAAIRTITLNRPDLVLLDYEMPVRDGRQTLEMLRSEKEFEDIPVIFLTGRADGSAFLHSEPFTRRFRHGGVLDNLAKSVEICLETCYHKLILFLD